MDLPVIGKYENMRPSISGLRVFFKARAEKSVPCGRVKTYFPQIAKYDYDSALCNDKHYKEEDTETIKNLTDSEILEILEECQLTGCGGGGFPTALKISNTKTDDRGKKTLIINAVECDIGLIHDDYVVRTYFDKIEAAAVVLKKAFNYDSVLLGTRRKNPEEGSVGVIEIRRVTNGYPAGAERILIHSLTGVVVPFTELPTNYGFTVLNVQTMLTIYNALTKHEVFSGKYITVLNIPEKQAIPLFVSFGTSVKKVANEVLGENKNLCVLTGGGAMRAHIAEVDEVTDSETGLIAIGERPKHQESMDCMSCKACVRACPMDLKVFDITDRIQTGNLEEAKAFSPEKCIGCNSCTYVCFVNRTNSDMIAKFNLEMM